MMRQIMENFMKVADSDAELKRLVERKPKTEYVPGPAVVPGTLTLAESVEPGTQVSSEPDMLDKILATPAYEEAPYQSTGPAYEPKKGFDECDIRAAKLFESHGMTGRRGIYVQLKDGTLFERMTVSKLANRLREGLKDDDVERIVPAIEHTKPVQESKESVEEGLKAVKTKRMSAGARAKARSRYRSNKASIKRNRRKQRRTAAFKRRQKRIKAMKRGRSAGPRKRFVLAGLGTVATLAESARKMVPEVDNMLKSEVSESFDFVAEAATHLRSTIPSLYDYMITEEEDWEDDEYEDEELSPEEIYTDQIEDGSLTVSKEVVERLSQGQFQLVKVGGEKVQALEGVFVDPEEALNAADDLVDSGKEEEVCVYDTGANEIIYCSYPVEEGPAGEQKVPDSAVEIDPKESKEAAEIMLKQMIEDAQSLAAKLRAGDMTKSQAVPALSEMLMQLDGVATTLGGAFEPGDVLLRPLATEIHGVPGEQHVENPYDLEVDMGDEDGENDSDVEDSEKSSDSTSESDPEADADKDDEEV